MGIKNFIQKKPYIPALLFCVAGIALNLALNAAVTALNLPLYLDTVGTITVAAIGGYLPGVIVGFVTNIIKSISDPSSLYYGALNVLIAIFAARLAWRGWFKNSFGIAGMIVIFTLIGGGLGALIPWFMEEITFDSESLSGMLLESGFFGRTSSHFLSSILMDLPDKVISVLMSVLLLRLIPQKIHRLFAIRGWMQKPIAEEDEVKTGSAHVRFLSLRDKLMIALGVSLVTVALAVMVISMRVFHKSIIREHTRIAQGTAEIAASVIDGDRVDAYLERGYSVKGYRRHI